MDLPRRIKSQLGVFKLGTGYEKSTGKYYAWYEPEDENLRFTFGPIVRSETQDEATDKLRQFYVEHKNEVQVL